MPRTALTWIGGGGGGVYSFTTQVIFLALSYAVLPLQTVCVLRKMAFLIS